MFCHKCGTQINDGAVFCHKCGAKVITDNVEQMDTSTLGESMQQTKQSDQQNYGQPIAVQQVKAESKNSKLGLIALIFSILGFTYTIGIILAIIDLVKKDGKKKTLSIIALVIGVIWIVIVFVAAVNSNDTQNTSNNAASEKANETKVETQTENNEKVKTEDIVEGPAEAETEDIVEEPTEVEPQDKYFVGDTWQNGYIKVTYLDCYEFTGYNQWSAPRSGYKIICADFEFENIGDSDSAVSSIDFYGYADGYGVQNYYPDGTSFLIEMSPGRKGAGTVAFEVPIDAYEIEIEFSTNILNSATSENIIFAFE